WKTHENRYPTLAIMAQNYLATTVTSIFVKCIFSESSNFINSELE
ncbi:31793_t:CDS:1, partial [Gigaspora margarita]